MLLFSYILAGCQGQLEKYLLRHKIKATIFNINSSLGKGKTVKQAVGCNMQAGEHEEKER